MHMQRHSPTRSGTGIHATHLVVQLQAVPVLVELLQAVLTHLGDPELANVMSADGTGIGWRKGKYAQVLRAPCDATAFLQAMRWVPVLRLAEHEVVCQVI